MFLGENKIKKEVPNMRHIWQAMWLRVKMKKIPELPSGSTFFENFEFLKIHIANITF